MTATTNTVLIEQDGEQIKREGVFFVKETTHPETNIDGVALQYADIASDEYCDGDQVVEFIPNGLIKKVYDVIYNIDEGKVDEFKALSGHSETATDK
jgi:hypothetical protein